MVSAVNWRERHIKALILSIVTSVLLVGGIAAIFNYDKPLKDGPWRVTLYTGNDANRSWLVNTRPDSITASCYKIEPDDGNAVIVCGNLTIERAAP